MDAETIAKLAGASQIMWIVHRHPACALHQGLDDKRSSFVCVALEVPFERLCAAARVRLRRFARLGQTPVRRRHLRACAQERSVSIAI